MELQSLARSKQSREKVEPTPPPLEINRCANDVKQKKTPVELLCQAPESQEYKTHSTHPPTHPLSPKEETQKTSENRQPNPASEHSEGSLPERRLSLPKERVADEFFSKEQGRVAISQKTSHQSTRRLSTTKPVQMKTFFTICLCLSLEPMKYTPPMLLKSHTSKI